ncbi:MAG: response regulator [Proteobacteria bacterium]|nr:response regulator [Pseudomonadota bacterium]MBU1688434.1 response regulator [Pseudomonadota bacterium]
MSNSIILFVDDEKSILKSLNRLFLGEDYDIHLAEGGIQALEMIDQGLCPKVIVSDQRMPLMGGAEFLAKAREKVPESIRMVLTGYADINAAMAAVNQGGIYRYLMKPWNDEDLKLSIQDAIQRYDLVQENKKLSLELNEKNILLNKVNEDLEQKVRERTMELEQKVRELEGRDRIQQFLMTIHPIGEAMGEIAGVLNQLITVKWIAVFLVESGAASTTPIYQHPGDFAIDPADLSGPLSTVVTSGQAINLKMDNLLAERSGSPGKINLALSPITSTEEILGVLVILRSEENEFSPAELRTLKGFCIQAAIAIKDSRMETTLPELESSLDDILNEFNS